MLHKRYKLFNVLVNTTKDRFINQNKVSIVLDHKLVVVGFGLSAYLHKASLRHSFSGSSGLHASEPFLMSSVA
jgi:hypothetical protein